MASRELLGVWRRVRGEGSPYMQRLELGRDLAIVSFIPPPLQGTSGKTRPREWVLSRSWYSPWGEGEGRMALDKIGDSLYTALGIPKHRQPRKTAPVREAEGVCPCRGESRSLVWSQPGQTARGSWATVASCPQWSYVNRQGLLQPQATPSPSPSLPGARQIVWVPPHVSPEVMLPLGLARPWGRSGQSGAELRHPEASCLYPASLPLPLGRQGGSWKSLLPRRGEQVGIGVSEDLGQNGEGGPGHGL